MTDTTAEPVVPEVAPAPADEKPTRTRRRRTTSTTRPRTSRVGKETPDKKPRAPRRPTAAATSGQVKTSIVTLHQLGAMGATLLGKPQTGAALESSAGDAAEVWAQLAQRYPAIGRILLGGGDAALIGSLLAVYVPVVMTALSEPRNPGASADMLGMFGAFAAGGAEQQTGEPAA